MGLLTLNVKLLFWGIIHSQRCNYSHLLGDFNPNSIIYDNISKLNHIPINYMCIAIVVFDLGTSTVAFLDHHLSRESKMVTQTLQ